MVRLAVEQPGGFEHDGFVGGVSGKRAGQQEEQDSHRRDDSMRELGYWCRMASMESMCSEGHAEMAATPRQIDSMAAATGTRTESSNAPMP